MADTPDKTDSTPEESALDIQNRERSAAFEASFEQEKQKVNDALRTAQPSWEREGAFHRPPPPVDRTNIKRWDDYQDNVVSSYETPDPVVTPEPVNTTTTTAAVEFPYQVIGRVSPDDPTVNQLGVISNSHLFNSEDKDTYEEDNSTWGLLDDDMTTGWFDTGALGDKIWLLLTLDTDQSILSIDIEHGAVGGANWPDYPDPIGINTDDPDNPYQQYYYQIIAELTDPETDPRPGFLSGTVQVTQLLSTNLMMTTGTTTADADEPDLPILIPVPFQAPGTATDGSADEINSGSDIMTPWQYGTTAINPFPFRLSLSKDGAYVDGTIYPGTVEGVVPTWGGGSLDDDTPPTEVITGPTGIWMQVFFSTDSMDFNRYHVDSAAISQEIDPADEFTITWDDPDTEDSGNYWVHIADVDIPTPGVGVVTQYLFASILSQAYIATDVIVISSSGIGS